MSFFIQDFMKINNRPLFVYFKILNIKIIEFSVVKFKNSRVINFHKK